MSAVPRLPAYEMHCRCGWEELVDLDDDCAAVSYALLGGWVWVDRDSWCPRCTARLFSR